MTTHSLLLSSTALRDNVNDSHWLFINQQYGLRGIYYFWAIVVMVIVVPSSSTSPYWMNTIIEI